MWIQRENFVEELKVNIFDDALCKAAVGKLQSLAWKDCVFGAVTKRTNDRIVAALVQGSQSARLTTLATFFRDVCGRPATRTGT